MSGEMKDLTIRGIHVPPTRTKWIWGAVVLGVTCWLLGICCAHMAVKERSIEKQFIASYLFIAARVLGGVAVIFVRPKLVFPLALILAPFFAAIFAMQYQPWTRWWFWPATLLCEIAGGYAMLRLGPGQNQKKA